LGLKSCLGADAYLGFTITTGLTNR
jgi:hypothetical protein